DARAGASEAAAARAATRGTTGIAGTTGTATPAQSPGGPELTPIWVGSLVHERLRRASWPFNVLTTYTDNAGSAGNAGNAGHAGRTGNARNAGPDLAAPGQPAGWRAITMPGSEGCEGRPVTLIVSGGH
ncbi:MAG TPA: hypothetical protein VJS30_08535, partial [Paraburkholderia sp.]|nr:hypothetical protein [Paraburkholderia sp.]